MFGVSKAFLRGNGIIIYRWIYLAINVRAYTIVVLLFKVATEEGETDFVLETMTTLNIVVQWWVFYQVQPVLLNVWHLFKYLKKNIFLNIL